MLREFAIIFLLLAVSNARLLADTPVIRWGVVQEGVKLGVALFDYQPPKNGWVVIYIAPGTNYAKNLVSPELRQVLEVVLKNSTNNPVEPRPGGTGFGAQLQTKMSRASRIRQQLRFPDAEGRPLATVKIDDCFLVKETKEYELEVRVRLLKEAGEKLVPVTFPPVKTKLHLVVNTIQ